LDVLEWYFIKEQIKNIGYQAFYSSILHETLEPTNTKPFVFTGIQKNHKKETLTSKDKKYINAIRKRIHGKEAKAAREVLELRIDAAEKLGTYGPSIAVVDNNKEVTNNTSPNQQQQAGKKYCKHCNAYTNHSTNRSKHCTKYPEWKLQQELKRNNKRNSRTNDVIVSNLVAEQPNGETTVATIIEATRNEDTVAEVQQKAAASSIEEPFFIEADAKYERLNILQSKNMIAEIMIQMKGQNVQKSSEKNIGNISTPASTNIGHTGADMFCTFIDPVQYHTNFDNVTGSTQNNVYNSSVYQKIYYFIIYQT